MRFFLFATESRLVLEAKSPPIQWVPGVKQPAREHEHSPPRSAETKNEWSYK